MEENFVTKIKNYWFNISDKIRFLIIGCCNASISYLIYSTLIFVLGESFYQGALAMAWVITSVISFTTQRLFVFNVKGNLIKQYLKCCTTWVFSYFINATLLELFVKHCNINVYLAQIFATFISAIFTYILFKKFAFRRKNESAV